MTPWHDRVQAALARLDAADRAWLDRLPPNERGAVIRLLVEFDATIVP